jgi:hypothetical protein
MLISEQRTVKQALNAWQNESLKHVQEEEYPVKAE